MDIEYPQALEELEFLLEIMSIEEILNEQDLTLAEALYLLWKEGHIKIGT